LGKNNMIAFDYYVNGKKVCTAGIEGAGVVATHVDLVRALPSKKGKTAREDVRLHVGGFYSETRTHAIWLSRQLVRGDTVRIDVVEAPKVDRPRKKKTESAESRLKRERDYVSKKAASWGWKIQKKKPNHSLQPTAPSRRG
jgi:hypothetical protein